MSASPDDRLVLLLEDAKRVAAYGSRAGKLVDSDLPLAIRRVEVSADKTWGSAEIETLQLALGKAVAQIAPATVLELRNRDPFSAGSRDRVMHYLLIVISLLLMGFTAYSTNIYYFGTELNARLEQIEAARPAEKMGAVARSWKAGGDTEKPGASETYYKLLDEVRDLDNKVRANLADYYKFREMLLERKIGSLLIPSASAISLPRQQNPLASSQPKQVGCGGPPAEQALGDVTFSKSPPGSVLAENKALLVNFACAEALMISPYSMPFLSNLGREVRQTISLYGQWVLPALYGALGALVYYLRSVLNPVLPDPPMEKIIHRVALGAFAGVIFAWIWTPDATPDHTFNGLTLNYFAIAFLIGFSIEVFFSVLDRMVQSIQETVSRPPPAAPVPPTSPVPATQHGDAL